MILSGVAEGQCPSPPPPPTSILWVAGATRTVTIGPNCVYYVDSCQRTVGGVDEFIFTRIEEDPSNTCGFDWDYIVSEVGTWFLGRGTDCDPLEDLPDCSGPRHPIQIVLDMATCWKVILVQHPDRPPTEAVGMCPESGMCRWEMFKCCNQLGKVNVWKANSTEIHTGSCTDAYETPFEYDHCYVMLYCE